MLKYSIIVNEETGLCNVGLGDTDEDIQIYKSIGMVERNVLQSDIDSNWYLLELCPMYTQEEKDKLEEERISNLKCTKRVLALMLQQLGISYTQLKELIATNEQAQLEWDLCVELERSNPLLDIMGQQLGITPEQIDNIFKFANGEIESLEV